MRERHFFTLNNLDTAMFASHEIVQAKSAMNIAWWNRRLLHLGFLLQPEDTLAAKLNLRNLIAKGKPGTCGGALRTRLAGMV